MQRVKYTGKLTPLRILRNKFNRLHFFLLENFHSPSSYEYSADRLCRWLQRRPRVSSWIYRWKETHGAFSWSPSSVPLMRGRGPRKSNRPESHHVPRCNHGYPVPGPGLIIIYVSYSTALHTSLPPFTDPLLQLIPCRPVARLRGNVLPLQFQPSSKRLVTGERWIAKRSRERGTSLVYIAPSPVVVRHRFYIRCRYYYVWLKFFARYPSL